MSLQHRMPLLPADAEIVSQHLAAGRADGRITFFNASGPILCYREGDEEALRVCAALLSEPHLDLATPSQIAGVIGRNRSRVHKYRRLYQESGASALTVKRTGPRGPNKLKGARLARAQEHLDKGKSNRKVAKLIGVSGQTIGRAIEDGRLVKPAASEPATETAASSPRERTDEDATCAGGVAVKRDLDRAMARIGKLPEAAPEFERAESVAKAGVLVALPALLGQGLLDVGEKVYGALSNGFFGLKSILLSFAFMALIRIKSTERLTDQAPGELGLALGLDRAPEMKTARRKLAELGRRGLALEFSRAFTERWVEEDPEALGYLYIDGHVRPYHGGKYKLPKTHVQRRRLCMPATTDYWVNDANAEPLMFVTAPANEGLLKMMDDELLPEIRKLAGEKRQMTLIFDREGWSPKRFKKWHKAHFDVITYRKGKYRDWPRRCFKEVKVKVCGRDVTYLLGERLIRLTKGFRMREVRRLCDDGHQTSVMSTRRDLSVKDVALRMFSRWQHENFFRYMRQEFALDHLPTTKAEQADPERTVPSPAVKQKKRELASAKARLQAAERKYGQKAYENPEQKRRTVRGFKITQSKLGRKIRDLRQTCERLKAEIKELPARVPVREVLDGKPVVQLERERKIITDTLKMVAYRAETQLANLVGPLLPYRADEARKFMRQVFELSADILPDHDQNRLVVRLHSMANPRSNRALRSLCDVLNDLKARFPGTRLRLVLEAAESR
jgi:hypothetical protein